MSKKYFWLKLHRDFFKRHDIRIIEDMDNGTEYILFYMKLLVESIDHEGRLRFNNEIPYNDKMLASVTGTNVDIVRTAVKLFSEMGMMELLDDGTLFMSHIDKMIGAETEWAKKKRDYRTIEKDNVRALSDKSKILEKEKEKEKEKSDKSPMPVHHGYGENKRILLTTLEYDKLTERWGKAYTTDLISKMDGYCVAEGKKYKSFYQALINWSKKEFNKPPTHSETTKPKYMFSSLTGAKNDK